jgi:hypothetical protein
MIWPRFPLSFWTFDGVMELIPEETDQPPLGLLTIAALRPKHWQLRLLDRSFAHLPDSDILWADLVMVSGMRVQKDDISEVLLRSRALCRRTMIGGPYASSEPESLPLADHVVVGEPDEIFDRIAVDLERGSAKRLYVIDDQPDAGRTPIPRFDLPSRKVCLHGRAVSAWLSIPVRVLRHHYYLWQEAQNQAAGSVIGGAEGIVRGLGSAMRFSLWTTI